MEVSNTLPILLSIRRQAYTSPVGRIVMWLIAQWQPSYIIFLSAFSGILKIPFSYKNKVHKWSFS